MPYKKISAIILAASLGVCAGARDFSKEFEYGAGTAGEQWYNWTTGGDGALWDLGGQAPTLEEIFYYNDHNNKFFTHGDQLVNGTVYAKNMTFVGNYGGQFNVDSGEASIEVAENIGITMEQNGTDFRFGDSEAMRGFKRITVGGNFEINGPNQTLYNTFVNKYAYGKDDLSMVVGGVVSFGQANGKWILRNGTGSTNPSENYMNSWIQMGGLNGESLRLATNDPGALSFNVVFKSDDKTAFTGGEWTGAFASWYSGGKTASITMDGGANGGLQTVRMLDSLVGSDNYEAMTTQTLSMLSGKLALGTESATKFTEATVSGGTLLIVDSSKANDKQGSFTADVLNLDGGEIIFDASKSGSDFISAGAINGSGTSLVIDLDPNDFQMGDNVDGVMFDIFRSVASADWEALGDSIKFLLGGEWVTVGDCTLNDGTLELSGVISAVPEPAVMAAVLGAFALAFAARRKK